MWHVIGIQYYTKITGGILKSIVDIAGLGIFAVVTSNMPDIQALANLFQVRIICFVAEIGGMWVMDFLDGFKSSFHHFIWLACAKSSKDINGKNFIGGRLNRYGNRKVMIPFVKDA
jgi:hypothetical protein